MASAMRDRDLMNIGPGQRMGSTLDCHSISEVENQCSSNMNYPQELREALGFYTVLHSNKKGNITDAFRVLKYSMGEQMHRADIFKFYQLRPNLVVKIC